jgi:transcriptional regulator with XRE-family HTH domain
MQSENLRDILAANIREYRAHKGLSQDEFADKCGLHRTYIGSVERSERNVTLATLELLSKATGITVPKLLLKGDTK